MPLPIIDDHALAGVKHIFGVASGKGGVGKSTVTASLARAFEQQGLTVGVLDADLYGPSIQQMLPEDKPPRVLDEAAGTLSPAICGSLQTVSMAHFRKEGEGAMVRAPIANGTIKQFLNNIAWGKLDVLLIDFPPGTGDIQLTLCQEGRLSGVLLVTTPQKVAQLDVLKAAQLFSKMEVPILGVLENMSYLRMESVIDLFGRGGGEALAEDLDLPFLGALPLEPKLAGCMDRGHSIFRTDPKGECAMLLLALAKRIWSQLADPAIAADVRSEGAGNMQIVWKNGQRCSVPVEKLQAHCPCIRCRDREFQPSDSKMEHFERVGNYGVRFQFASGCSKGIYPLQLLRSLGTSC